MDLQINFEDLKSTANKVITKGQEFEELLTKIKASNEELKSYWEGTDASQYSTKVGEQAVYMDKLAETIKEIGAFLDKVGNAYQEAQENNTLN